MSDLIAPLDGVMVGKCVDGPETRVHEDMFRITRIGRNVQVDIAAVAPPTGNFSRGKLQRELSEIDSDNGEEPFGFLEKYKRREFGFSASVPKCALVASYVYNEDEGLVFEELSLCQALGQILTYTNYNRTEERFKDNTVLKKILRHKTSLSRQIKTKWPAIFYENRGRGQDNIFLMQHLFNDSCRKASIQTGVTFIGRVKGKNGEDFFVLRDSRAKYKCTLVDPCAFINASNLIDNLSGVPPIFTPDFLQNRLGKDKLLAL